MKKLSEPKYNGWHAILFYGWFTIIFLLDKMGLGQLPNSLVFLVSLGLLLIFLIGRYFADNAARKYIVKIIKK